MPYEVNERKLEPLENTVMVQTNHPDGIYFWQLFAVCSGGPYAVARWRKKQPAPVNVVVLAEQHESNLLKTYEAL